MLQVVIQKPIQLNMIFQMFPGKLYIMEHDWQIEMLIR